MFIFCLPPRWVLFPKSGSYISTLFIHNRPFFSSSSCCTNLSYQISKSRWSWHSYCNIIDTNENIDIKLAKSVSNVNINYLPLSTASLMACLIVAILKAGLNLSNSCSELVNCASSKQKCPSADIYSSGCY